MPWKTKEHLLSFSLCERVELEGEKGPLRHADRPVDLLGGFEGHELDGEL